MPVSDADVAELRRRNAEGGDAGDDLRALQSHAEVIGFLVACARQQGSDECDAVELLVRAAELPREDIRQAERLLRKLGYLSVSDKLRELAKKARRKPAPYCWHMHRARH